MCQMSESCIREDHQRDLRPQKEFEKEESERKIREPIERKSDEKRYLNILKGAKASMKRIGWD